MSRLGRPKKKDAGSVESMSLLMECGDEEMSPAQAAFFKKCETDFNQMSASVDQRVKANGGEIIEKASDHVYTIEMTVPGNAPSLTPLVSAVTPASVPQKNIVTRQQTPTVGTTMVQAIQSNAGPMLLQSSPGGQSIVTRSSNTLHATGGTYQLVMDPRLGLVVGPLTSAQPTSGTSLAKQPPAVVRTTNMQVSPMAQTRVAPARNQNNRAATAVTKTQVTVPQASQQPTVVIPGKSVVVANQVGVGRGGKRVGPPGQPVSKPTENNSVGGLMAGGSKQWKPPSATVVDLTSEDGTKQGSGHVPDSREVMFSKLSGKTFPSLVVVARPHLRVKDIPPVTVTQGRTALDAKVKSVLMFTPTKFTEWLIQQGLVRSEQGCTSHVTSDMVAVKLKLGMYSDVSKFPYSGGYVWISECCPHRFVSVFSGSIFEGAPHPPTILLKLVYHWSTQTNVQNVVQWVKVDNFYVKNFFTNMRSVCTAAVHEKYEKMGGARKRVEVGVISLGTTSQDGNMRQVKVEVLGVMEAESKLIRLRAVEPLMDGEKNYKKRFTKILEPLADWVYKDSIILTDFTVDKGTLHAMGFNTVYQVSVTESNLPPRDNKFSNSNVMEYLRRIVPRMFQNTLSLLSRQIIQQFLDELVWRERWGPVASQAFENILAHMAEQTKLDFTDSLLTRLSKISSNPFKQWNYRANPPPAPTQGQSKVNGTTPQVPEPLHRPMSIDMLPQSIRSIDPPASALPKPVPVKRARKRLAGDTSTGATPAKKFSTSPIMVGDQTSLESYYYGTMEGDPNIVKKEYKSISAQIKCCVCPKKFTNNLLLMRHLILHAQSDTQPSSTASEQLQCKYCIKTFATQALMQAHINMMHIRSGLMCRICEETFTDRSAVITHMHRTHLALEMPYECGVCTFRSSMHRDVIDHFYELHSGSEKMQCPLCLKIVSFSNQGNLIDSNINFYLNHIQKHLRKAVSRKCEKCNLWFVHKGILKEHQSKDHTSFKGQPGVRMFVQTQGGDIMMPLPSATAYKPPPTVPMPKLKTLYSLEKLNLTISGVKPDAKCNECEGDFLDPEHFVGLQSCSKCRFTTCCSKAMTDHAVIFHEHNKTAEFNLGKPCILKETMYCICGFKSDSGNKIAKHLARCEKKSAYPTAARAQAAIRRDPSASFPPLVTLDDAPGDGDTADPWTMKGFAATSRKDDPSEGAGGGDPDSNASAAPPSMLNILGLVRKPSMDESADAEETTPPPTAATDAAPREEVAAPSEGKKVLEEDGKAEDGKAVGAEEDGKAVGAEQEAAPEVDATPAEPMEVDAGPVDGSEEMERVEKKQEAAVDADN